MSKYQRVCLLLLIAAIGAAVVSSASIAEAQRTRSVAERRQSPGEGFWANQRASRNMSHARDYSRGFYNYARSVQTIRPEVAKSEAMQLGRSVEACKTELATVRKEYEGNQAVAESAAVIDKHLAAAAQQQKILEEECHKDAPDAKACMHCCNLITKELEKATAEHAALIRTLEIEGIESRAQEQTPERRE